MNETNCCMKKLFLSAGHTPPPRPTDTHGHTSTHSRPLTAEAGGRTLWGGLLSSGADLLRACLELVFLWFQLGCLHFSACLSLPLPPADI